MSKTFFPMMLTVFAAVLTYYFLSTQTNLQEHLSMTGGVIVGAIGAVLTKNLFNRK